MRTIIVSEIEKSLLTVDMTQLGASCYHSRRGSVMHVSLVPCYHNRIVTENRSCHGNKIWWHHAVLIKPAKHEERAASTPITCHATSAQGLSLVPW
jgi:hypothetical protein